MCCVQVRLSERNVVELVSKLRQLGFLGDDLLHSINGREYLTPDHLCKEVKDAVSQAGGRVALVMLYNSKTICKESGALHIPQDGECRMSPLPK